MPSIKPVSDLRNYNEVLQGIEIGRPVFLTKNERGLYAILDIREYEKTQATIKLMEELQKVKKVPEKKDGLLPKKLKNHLVYQYESNTLHT